MGGIACLLASALVDVGVSARLSGSDQPVNVGAGDRSDISAHNSPTIVRNPRDPDNLAVTSRIDSPDFSCALHVSTDRGRTWSRTRVAVPRGGGRVCYAPDAAFGADGTLHVSYVTLRGTANSPHAAWVASSRDGGRTLSAPHRVTGPLAFQVRIAADPAVPGRLYLTWLQARELGVLKFTAPGNPIRISRSDDGGRRWRRPVTVNDPRRRRVLAPSAAIGPRGEVYVLLLDVGEDRLDYEGGHEAFGGPPYAGRFTLVVMRSRDRGLTWRESVVDDRVVPIERFVAFLPPFPSIAVDGGSGRVHVGFHDARLGTADVWVWSLDPAVQRWRPGVRVNDTPRRDGTGQYLPRLAANDGRLDVVYYDRRDDRPRNVRNEVSLQTSDDGGRTFGSRVVLSSRPFDSRIGQGSDRGLPDLGSRIGLVSDEDRAVAVWSDTRAGTDASSKQDIVRAEAVVERPARTRDFTRYAGLVLALAGLVVALVAGRGRRAGRSGEITK